MMIVYAYLSFCAILCCSDHFNSNYLSGKTSKSITTGCSQNAATFNRYVSLLDAALGPFPLDATLIMQKNTKKLV